MSDEPSLVPFSTRGATAFGGGNHGGFAAAVVNAIYSATGMRLREYLITFDKLIAKLPEIRAFTA